MIRLFIVVGFVGVAFASYLATYGQGPDYQMSPSVSLLEQFEADGVVPSANDLVENDEVEHGIFEVPPEDERQLEMAMSMGGMGMNMGGMNMGAGDATTMTMGADGQATMAMDGDAAKDMPMDMAKDSDATTMTMGTDGRTTMAMDGDAAKNMPMDMAKDSDAMTMTMGADGQSTMKMDETGEMKMPMDAKEPEGHGGDEDDGGLKITEGGSFDREIDLTMAEWKFSKMTIDVKSGERIRFNVVNGGKIPHEFMFMSMPAMAAVNYRARRADWNLLEHEALFEKSLVLPGGKFSFVAEIKEDGAWMFMCMLPYHMQMGMMGQMATPGMAMDMQM